ncbi:metalloregulator ArsR/SmtB family transcription factor [Rubrivirga sp.]|uniref:metalloregulator ArsR/SmtB family transcription factor n=1 Tax=Rubrivirga sp. TaxID=1885344 RepID=UPI003B523574
MSLFKALGDPSRRAVLDLLRDGDRTAGEIAEALGLPAPTASHHLGLLRQAGLVTSEKDGRFVRYTLATTALEEAAGWIAGLLAARPSPSDAPARP